MILKSRKWSPTEAALRTVCAKAKEARTMGSQVLQDQGTTISGESIEARVLCVELSSENKMKQWRKWRKATQ